MMDNNRHINLQYFAGLAAKPRTEEDTEIKFSDSDSPKGDIIEHEEDKKTEDYTDKQVTYPGLDLADKNGNTVRDARNFVFNSRVISTANKAISANELYNHYEP